MPRFMPIQNRRVTGSIRSNGSGPTRISAEFFVPKDLGEQCVFPGRKAPNSISTSSCARASLFKRPQLNQSCRVAPVEAFDFPTRVAEVRSKLAPGTAIGCGARTR